MCRMLQSFGADLIAYKLLKLSYLKGETTSDVVKQLLYAVFVD